MKIALMNEFSQAAKNPIILNELKNATEKHGHTVFNVGMDGDNDKKLTYVHLGIISAILLNSKAVDFVITGCGTGQGALMALNAFPGVNCGYCIEPTDAYLFAQVNNGNALSLAFAKGFGWGAELNARYIFEKAFDSLIEALKSIDQSLLKDAIRGERFQKCLFENSQDPEITAYIKSLLA
jgi:Ribose 5-phosphate isomerase RpiB